MSLSLSLNNALSGLKASQQSIAVISQNIANANNEDYSRQVATQSAVSIGNSIGSGVIIDEVSRVVDDFISKTVITRTSDLEKAKAIEEFYNQAQTFMGAPGEDNSLDTFISDVFTSFNELSSSPEVSALKFNAVNSANILAGEISSLAQNIESLRFEADQQISDTVKRINSNVTTLQDLNIAIASAASNGESANTLSDEITATLKDLAADIEIQYFIGDNKTVSVYTANGATLLDSSRYELQYTEASSVDNFINNTALSSIKLFAVDSNGELNTKSSTTIVSSGVKDGVTTDLSTGKLAGLLEIRDSLFPDIIDQLDQMANVLTDGMNAMHNNGVAFPPPTDLTGTTLIDPTDTSQWAGNVMIMALNPDGTPAASAYASQTTEGVGYEALTLNLGGLSDANGVVGTNSFQSIIDEINHHFGVPQNVASIGDISNIELVSKSDSLVEGIGNFNFDIELNNLNSSDATYRITGVTTNDAGVTVTTPAAFPTSTLTASAGEKALSGESFTLDMTGADDPGPYTITLAIEVDDGAGGTFTDTIDYVLPEATSGLTNDRSAANAVGGTDAVIETPATNKAVLAAMLVNADGNEISKDANGNYTQSGYLKIAGDSLDGADIRFGISELDSSYKGETSTSVDGNGFGFSHFLGLNNLYVDSGQVAGSAVKMSMEQRLEDSPASITAGQLKLSTQPTDSISPPKYTYEISKGSNTNSIAVADFILNPSSFSSAGGLPNLSISIANYAAEFLGLNAALTSNAIDEARKENLILNGFKDKDDSVRGVNVDEELANTIIFQNAYTANARVISVTKELFDDLLNVF